MFLWVCSLWAFPPTHVGFTRLTLSFGSLSPERDRRSLNGCSCRNDFPLFTRRIPCRNTGFTPHPSRPPVVLPSNRCPDLCDHRFTSPSNFFPWFGSTPFLMQGYLLHGSTPVCQARRPCSLFGMGFQSHFATMRLFTHECVLGRYPFNSLGRAFRSRAFQEVLTGRSVRAFVPLRHLATSVYIAQPPITRCPFAGFGFRSPERFFTPPVFTSP